MNFFEGEMSLEKVRQTLIRLEDTIIFQLIERSQFGKNKIIYENNKFGFKDFNGSFLEYYVKERESLDSSIRRYDSPDELPFFDKIQKPILPNLDYPKVLHPNNINVNKKIWDSYINNIVPRICHIEDDSNYGSSATIDTSCLQALSRRIHFGKFVAEAKFTDPKYHDEYVKLITNQEKDKIYELLTNEDVERKLLTRVEKKARTFGQDIEFKDNDSPHLKIQPIIIPELYRDFIMPLTKEVELEYLLNRLNNPNMSEKEKEGNLHSSVDKENYKF
ncbi:chorismate mutase [Piromyces finnis]|uniref:Chorismate mutase n=1 Tax=Piromyces finnis TaxID=1754191 RepID=A0A1Y1V5N3_9FUNG|nr:chorismate mutase [Piromyces finnis]|eukprot:ORX47877.1 chorismate mutase [Piromyces finnis]